MSDPMPSTGRRPPSGSAPVTQSTGSVPAAHASGSGGAPSGTPYAPEGEVHLLDRLAVLYRYRRLCISVFILVTAAMIIQGYSSVQMYQAQGRLLIEDERSTAIPGLQNDQNTFFEDPEPYYQTQYKILKGRDLTRRVIKKVHLEQIPEFNGTAAPPPTPLTFLSNFKSRVIGLVRPTPPPQEAPQIDETSDESALVGAFIGRVGVEPVRGSRLVDVTFTSMD